MNYITNVNEALEEARRLSKVRRRDVEAKAIDCDCDYSPACFYCGGSGTYYVPVFAFCDHIVSDTDDLCDEDDCAERERLSELMKQTEHLEDPFSRIARPLQSCQDRAIEQEESEAA